MRIDVSGHQFVFPPVCACCGKGPDAVWTVTATRSRGAHTTAKHWDIPYCRSCIIHASEYQTGYGLAVLAFVVACVLALIVGNPFGAPVFVCGVVGSVILYRRRRSVYEKQRAAALAHKTATCSATGAAVTYFGWDGTVHSFDMVEAYGTAFLLANRTKVVNESFELRRYLDQFAPETQRRNVQRPRRYER
jgi:hypothetical protein